MTSSTNSTSTPAIGTRAKALDRKRAFTRSILPQPPCGRGPDQAPASSRNATSLSTARLAREAEHTLADHIALDLLGTATDPAAPLHEELLLPVAVGHRVGVVEHRHRALEREHEVAVELLAARSRELEHGRLGTEALILATPGAPAQPLDQLEAA